VFRPPAASLQPLGARCWALGARRWTPGYPSRLKWTWQSGLVQHGLQTLEADGLVARRREGRVCQVYLSPTYVAHTELRDYLRRLVELRQGRPDGEGGLPRG